MKIVGPKFFHVGISWVQIFSRGYFVDPVVFLMANFVIQRFPVAGCMRKSDRKQKYRNKSQTTYSYLHRFQ